MSALEEMAAEAEFAAFLRDAPVEAVAAQTLEMIGSLEKARDSIQGVEWSRVSRTAARLLEMFPADAPVEVAAEMRMALRVAELFAEVDAKLVQMAIEQQAGES